MHPAKEKSPQRAEATTQVGVLAAGFRNHRPQFSVGERAEEGQNPTDNPRGENDGNEAAVVSHFGGLEEDSCADHGADHDRAGSPGTEPTYQLEAFFFHFADDYGHNPSFLIQAARVVGIMRLTA